MNPTTKPLPDLYRDLHVPQYDAPWGWSGRNEAANTVAIQIDSLDLREATASERRRGIAKVCEFAKGDDGRQAAWKSLLDDLAFADAQDSYVRAIVFTRRDSQRQGGEWRLLPNLGRVVGFDEDAGTYKIVFFD